MPLIKTYFTLKPKLIETIGQAVNEVLDVALQVDVPLWEKFLKRSTKSARQIYWAYLEEGFSESQAFELTTSTLASLRRT